MFDFFGRLWEQFSAWYGRLGTKEKVVVFSVIGGAFVLLIVVIITTTGKREYDFLYRDLSPKDAAAVVAKLKETGVPYELAEDGTAVRVPKERVYELRLQLASEGIPLMGGLGYELFDKTSLGMTDFVQRLNRQRALETELARTIQSLEEVRSARVHLVIPEEAIFKEDQKEASARVVVHIRQGRELSKQQVRGIAHLVGGSVEGLDIGNVLILDSSGNILPFEEREPSLPTAATKEQIDLQRRVESYLTQKVFTLLSSVLGEENVRVRVTADLDFDQVEQTVEAVDPSNTVVISEERRIGGTGQDTTGTDYRITNYEMGKTVKQIAESVGGITRLSVAVLVNGRYDTVLDPRTGKPMIDEETGEARLEYIDRDPTELAVLDAIVRNAVGFNPERGDQVSVKNVKFETISKIQAAQRREFAIRKKEAWGNLIRKTAWSIAGIIILIVGVRIYLVKSRERTIRERQRREQEEAQRRLEQIRRVREGLPDEAKRIVLDNPEIAARLLRSWLAERR